MERLNERLGVASRALKSFNELANLANPNAIERDAAIQRFEYTFEAVWKAVKLYLNAVEGIDVASRRPWFALASKSVCSMMTRRGKR